MRRALAAIAVVAVTACGAPSSPQPPPLVVDDRDAAAHAAATASTAGKPLPDAPSAEVAALQRCSARDSTDPELRDALATTIKLAGAGPITDRALVDALWSCFARFRPSQASASIMVVRDLFTAVLAVKDDSYGPKATAKIAAPVRDPKDPAESMDEIQFWQATSIRLVGELRYAPAARPLVKVLLDDAKKDLTYPTRYALAKISKDAEPVLIAALAGTDPELVQLGGTSVERAYVARIADALGMIGRPTGRDAILDALPKVTDDANRAVLATTLSRFPATPRSQKAFLEAYAKIPANAAIMPFGGANGHALLTGAAASFFDPSLTEWLLRENAAAKGEAADAMPAAALPSAIKLMTPANAKNVGAAVHKIPGVAIEKDMYMNALATLDACKKNVACYLKELAKPVPSAPPSAQMGHVKAAWMAGMYGDASTRAALVDRLAAVKDGSVRLAIAEAIQHLSPRGDVAAADEIDALVAAEKTAGVMSGLDDLAQLAMRLRARAQ